MNDITEKEAYKMGKIYHKVWLIHNAPDMGDCRELNYYYEFKDGKIYCQDIDITDNVDEYDYGELIMEKYKDKIFGKNK